MSAILICEVTVIEAGDGRVTIQRDGHRDHVDIPSTDVEDNRAGGHVYKKARLTLEAIG